MKTTDMQAEMASPWVVLIADPDVSEEVRNAVNFVLHDKWIGLRVRIVEAVVREAAPYTPAAAAPYHFDYRDVARAIGEALIAYADEPEATER